MKSHYFPPTPNIDKLQMAEPSIYMMSTPDQADVVARIIKKLYVKNIAVLDANAHVGGNTFALLKHKYSVHACELDKKYFAMLQNNVKILYPDAKIEYRNDSILNLLKTPFVTNCKVGFFDPEWGGPSYSRSNKIGLFYQNIPFWKAIKDLKMDIIAKVPRNYNHNPLLRIAQNTGRTLTRISIRVQTPDKNSRILYYLLVISKVPTIGIVHPNERFSHMSYRKK
jgi:hypothetical protein